MNLDLPLVSLIEIGETVSLRPLDVEAGDYAVTSAHPNIVKARDDGSIVGLAPGQTTVTLAARDDPGPPRELPVKVVPAWTDVLELRSTHPRLRYTPDEIAARRELMTREELAGLGLRPRRLATAFLARADELVAESALDLVFEITGETFRLTLPYPFAQPEPLPQPYGFTDYPFWTRLSREIEQRLITLAMAWSLTGDTRYAEKARGILLSLAGWAKWHEYDKPTNNLSLPHFTMGAAVAYDELYDQLPEADRARVGQAIMERGLRPMSYWLEHRLDHNILVLMSAGMIFGALAIGDETPFTAKYVAMAMDSLLWYLEQREHSGTTEGLVYTSYALNTILNVATAARRAAGDDRLLQSPFLRTTLPDLFLYLRGGDGGYANLSDARYENDATILMLKLVNEFADRRAAWLVRREGGDNRQLFPHLQRDVDVVSPDQLRLPRSRHFAPFDWVALRSGWGDDDTLLAFVASPSAAGHNHLDQNHFILNTGGDWLITDPGYQNYTPGPENFFTNATIGHNALLVNGEGQLIRGHGRIVQADLTDDLDVVCGDATAAYEGRVNRWQRHIVYVKPDYFLIVDDIIPANPDDQLTLLFHTDQTVTANQAPLAVAAVIPDGREAEIAFSGRRASVSLQFRATAPIELRHAQYPGAERFGTYLVAALTAAPRHLVVTVLRPGLGSAPSSAVDVRFSGDADAADLIVEHAGGRDRHRIVRPSEDGPLRYRLLERAGSAPMAGARERG